MFPYLDGTFVTVPPTQDAAHDPLGPAILELENWIGLGSSPLNVSCKLESGKNPMEFTKLGYMGQRRNWLEMKVSFHHLLWL